MIENVIDAHRPVGMIELLMLVIGGRERTEANFRSLLAAAGLRNHADRSRRGNLGHRVSCGIDFLPAFKHEVMSHYCMAVIVIRVIVGRQDIRSLSFAKIGSARRMTGNPSVG